MKKKLKPETGDRKGRGEQLVKDAENKNRRRTPALRSALDAGRRLSTLDAGRLMAGGSLASFVVFLFEIIG